MKIVYFLAAMIVPLSVLNHQLIPMLPACWHSVLGQDTDNAKLGPLTPGTSRLEGSRFR